MSEITESEERLARPLIRLAKLVGVGTSYLGMSHDYHEIDDDVLIEVLAALGIDASSESAQLIAIRCRVGTVEHSSTPAMAARAEPMHNQISIFVFIITEETRGGNHHFPSLKLLPNGPFSVFTHASAFFLCKRSEDGKHHLTVP